MPTKNHVFHLITGSNHNIVKFNSICKRSIGIMYLKEIAGVPGLDKRSARFGGCFALKNPLNRPIYFSAIHAKRIRVKKKNLAMALEQTIFMTGVSIALQMIEAVLGMELKLEYHLFAHQSGRRNTACVQN